MMSAMLKVSSEQTDYFRELDVVAPPSCRYLKQDRQGVEAVTSSPRGPTDFQSVALPVELPGRPRENLLAEPSSGVKDGRAGRTWRYKVSRRGMGGRRLHLTDEQVVEVRVRHANGEGFDGLGHEFHTAPKIVAEITRGQRFAGVGGPITHDSRKRDSLEDRFWSCVDRSAGAGACWPWKRSLSEDGYGTCSRKLFGEKITSRFALGLKLGRRVRPDLKALHTCDNPGCCNPEHLREGTDKDNALDRESKGRGHDRRGEEQGRHVLSASAVVALRSEFRGIPRSGRLRWMAAKAAEHGVTQSTVGKVVYGSTWRHLPLVPPARTEET